ncbi:uncharacterized protein TRUGW13939_03240 [Talaromyces rugulosus]|uniref:Uncharacterized protein n=1 Tax=Talaromyces rugulosus TaxID=121627 RepID=A0A7H8QQB4_TALRU|nr:uncharacterized protein TRUGW13939_03240 [Talaromyces rugulosus]QKX56140.1 hypothetical protein TRUGW13939_03240 [Talaromyces rugulosus]
MSSTNASLEAAATERKARLAKLAALKRKQPEPESLGDVTIADEEPTDEAQDIAKAYLSGRNYDPETRGPKLGFEQAPTDGRVTLEQQASEIARKAAEQAEKDEEAEQPIDLFKLQPKKPNWDLKRYLDEKTRVLNVRTENAIARLVRERIENAQRAGREKARPGNAEGDGEEVGIEGDALVEGIHVREQEANNEDEDMI